MTDFIAEISSNHNGDLGRCRDLIAAAARAGCRGVKFQLFCIDRLFAREILQVSPEHRRRRRWELPPWFLPDLAACCRDHGVAFGCTPFDLEAVDLLAPHVDFLKVASYELPWLALTQRCAATGLPLMISTGMADAGEIRAAVAAAVEAGCADPTVFHCVSSYPAAAAECNLAALGALGDLVRPLAPRAKLGWSDHSVDPGVVRRAVDRWGAEVVEFHFDLEGRGEEFGGGHCWLPGTIAPVIAGGDFPADPVCDGDGRLGPVPAETAERPWRADPSDGLRPTFEVRRTWPPSQPGFAPRGPVLAFVPVGLGMGHLMRCLALAEALREKHDADCRFLIPDVPGHARVLDRHGFRWSLLPPEPAPMAAPWLDAVVAGAGRWGAKACMADAMEPAGSLVARLRTAGIPSIVIDQPGTPGADLVIVPSLVWSPSAPGEGQVGGPDYLLLREDVRAARPARPQAPPAGPILVTFGGADPHGLTERCLDALAVAAPGVEVRAVIHPGFDDYTARRDALSRRPGAVRLIEAGDGLAPLLASAGLVVTAWGVTVAEAMCCGAPVAVLSNWDRDRTEVRDLAERGLLADLGHHAGTTNRELAAALGALWSSASRRSALAAAGWAHCDGLGAVRAADRVAPLLRKGGTGPC